MNSWHWYVYIIECKDGTYYTGRTWSTDNRMEQHASGLGSKHTAKHGFKALVYTEEYNDPDAAKNRENQLKDWSQAKKRKLISGEWNFQ